MNIKLYCVHPRASPSDGLAKQFTFLNPTTIGLEEIRQDECEVIVDDGERDRASIVFQSEALNSSDRS